MSSPLLQAVALQPTLHDPCLTDLPYYLNEEEFLRKTINDRAGIQDRSVVYGQGSLKSTLYGHRGYPKTLVLRAVCCTAEV